MAISIIQRICVSRAAKKDAKGAYGEYLKEWYMNIQKEGKSEFELSEFMSRCVLNYTKRCERKLSQTRSLQRQYTLILGQCTKLDEKLKLHEEQVRALQDKISNCDSEIQTRWAELKSLKKAWTKANNAGNLPPDLGVSTLKELKLLIDQKEQESEKKTKEKDSLKNELQKKQKKMKADFPKESSQLEKLMLAYRNQINRLYRDLMLFANKQDKSLVYYWHVLCEQLEKKSKLVKYEQVKSFAEICRLKHVHLLEEKELFAQERAEINRRTSHYPDFPIEV